MLEIMKFHRTPVHVAVAVALVFAFATTTASADEASNLLENISQIAREQPLTDATAVFDRFGISAIRAAIYPDHVWVSPIAGNNIPRFGLTTLALIPFRVDTKSGSPETTARLFGTLDASRACIRLADVQRTFGPNFTQEQPGYQIVESGPLGQHSTRHESLPAISYKDLQTARSTRVAVYFQFSPNGCANQFVMSSRLQQ